MARAGSIPLTSGDLDDHAPFVCVGRTWTAELRQDVYFFLETAGVGVVGSHGVVPELAKGSDYRSP